MARAFWQETCVKDEQAALNKIAAILSELTAKKTTMVRLYIACENKLALVDFSFNWCIF